MKIVETILTIWLCFTISTVYCFPTIHYTTSEASVGCYQLFIGSIRRALASDLTSHDIPVLCKPSSVTKDDEFLLIQLLDGDSPANTITLAMTTVNAYIIGYRAYNHRSFFFKDAPDVVEAVNNGLFDGTTKVRLLSQGRNYDALGDRMKYPLGFSSPIKNVIDILRRFGGKTVDEKFQSSFLVLIQVISEASRFKFLQRKIEGDIYDSYKPQGVAISYENSWDPLSEQIQLAGADGSFRRKIQLENEDFSPRYVSNVADVKEHMGLLLYKGSGERFRDRIQQKQNESSPNEDLIRGPICGAHYEL